MEPYNMPMSGLEAGILGLAALAAWGYLLYGPQIEARVRAWKLRRLEKRAVKTPKAWTRRNFFG